MIKEILQLDRLDRVTESKTIKSPVLSSEVRDAEFEFISIKGPDLFKNDNKKGIIDVILTIKGKGEFIYRNKKYPLLSNTIIRVPLDTPYEISVNKGDELHFILIRRLLDEDDLKVIENRKIDYSELYFKAVSECPTYREDIKSNKTINRMILPEGLVPRFALGSVETEGPDEVGEHEHPMLDQVFLGLEGCQCYCYAEGEEEILTENMMLHIPLCSNHYVKVKEGDKLAYIWMDFFLTIEGEKYMGEQHHVEEE